MEEKFTGIVKSIEPIQRSGANKDHPRQAIEVKGIGLYNKSFKMFTKHGGGVEKYPVSVGDVVDVYYRSNTGRYPDTGKLHGSNNVLSIVQVGRIGI